MAVFSPHGPFRVTLIAEAAEKSYEELQFGDKLSAFIQNVVEKMDGYACIARLVAMRKSLIATVSIAVMAATGLAACSSGSSATNEKSITKDPATVVETGVKIPEKRDLELKVEGDVSKAKVEVADAEIAEQVGGSKTVRVHPKKVGESTIKLTDANGKEFTIPLEVVEGNN